MTSARSKIFRKC